MSNVRMAVLVLAFVASPPLTCYAIAQSGSNSPDLLLDDAARTTVIDELLKKIGNLADKDLYILTSSQTFSAPESFAYDMQVLKRATIVGETTGGGAHGTAPYRITDHFIAGIPFSRSINPVTKTDWEGVGVKPDVAVPADRALLAAHLLALKQALKRHRGDRKLADGLERTIAAKKLELDALESKSAKP